MVKVGAEIMVKVGAEIMVKVGVGAEKNNFGSATLVPTAKCFDPDPYSAASWIRINLLVASTSFQAQPQHRPQQAVVRDHLC